MHGSCAIVILSHFWVGFWVLSEHKYLVKHDKNWGRRGSGEKESNRGEHARGMFFCNKRSCVIAQKDCELYSSYLGCKKLSEDYIYVCIGAYTEHTPTWNAQTHKQTNKHPSWSDRFLQWWEGVSGGVAQRDIGPFRWTICLQASLTLHTRAMRDTMVLSKKSNSFPASLKKK